MNLTPLQKERFDALEPLYREWNSRINVISRKDIDNLYSHHVLHSLSIAEYLKVKGLEESFSTADILDLGTGGGFPGIPLAILYENARFTLCDSVGKKTIVASAVAESLGLQNVKVVNARAESLGERFDYVVSRAVASLPELYGWVKGRFSERLLCLKGGDIAEEVATLMGRYHLPKGSVTVWPVSTCLEDPYFEGKLLIDIPGSAGK